MIYLLLLLIGCAKGPNYIIKDQGYSTPEIEALKLEFEDDFGFPVHTNVVFVKEFTVTNANQIAVCIYDLNRVEIKDNNTARNKLNLIVYHELGHCVLGADHYEGEEDIMNANLFFSVNEPGVWNRFVTQMYNNWQAGLY